MSTIILILFSLFFSAFFSGIGIAFVSSNKLRFELERKRKNISDSILNIFYKNDEQFISTMLIGNIVALIIYCITIVEFLHPYIILLSKNQVSIFLIQIFISTIIIIFTSEFLPKTLFRINPNSFLRFFAIPLYVFYILLYPIAMFSKRLSIIILRIHGVKQFEKNKKHPLGKIDLNYLIQESTEKSQDNTEIESEVKLFQNALDFSDVKLRNCIVPRTEIVSVSTNASLDELKNKFIESGNSKILVYKDNIDNIVGYIDSAEMFNDAENWKSRIKQMPIVPETMAANKLMKLFTQKKRNIAVVVDEFGGTSGIVTLEDIMEEIFGEIEDEHDTKEYVSKKISDKEYILSGRLEIDSINEQFDLDLPSSDDYVTIAGLILYYYEKLPKQNEKIKIDKFTIQIIKMSKNKIELVKLTL